MKKPKLTPWFPPDIKPVHVGVYQVQYIGIGPLYFASWSGNKWGHYRATMEGAARYPEYRNAYQSKHWRGLAVKPKLTPWFPPEIKPVHVGVYAVRISVHDKTEYWAKWTGLQWGLALASLSDAEHIRDYCWAYQDKQWRGLAVKP